MNTGLKTAGIILAMAAVAGASWMSEGNLRPAGAADGAASVQTGVASQPATASRPADAKSKTEPAGLPFEARLILKKDKYAMAPEQSGEAFVKLLKMARGLSAAPPAPPAVDMTFELTNTGKDPLIIPLGSDLGGLELKLEGPGAVSIPYAQVHTMEFRGGSPTKIEPGKSITIQVAKLLYGIRGDSGAAYWTAPGTYTLTAYYVTTVSGLEGEKFNIKKDQPIIIYAAPVKVEVVEGGGAATKP